jgi:periplasmic protein TonB
MFDLITGQARHIPSKPGVPILISMSAQLAAVTALIVPVLFFTGTLPEVPTMMAFVAEAPAPPPPPPPPPRPPAPKTAVPPATKSAPSPGAAPVEPPSTIQPERPNDEGDIGVPGGVEGGIPGGVVGGIIGGLPGDIPPPPPPAPPLPRPPVRVGGQIQAPAQIKRVDPIYPDIAVSARIRGVVIVEATVDKDGRVSDVKVLRTANRLLDDAAITAVKQWQYRPLILNGLPEQFVLTVVLTFNLVDS